MRKSQVNRRAVLGAIAGAGGLPLLLPSSQAQAQTQLPARDLIKELGVRPCINAAGTYTALTGSLMPPEVIAAIQVASRQYVRLNELHDAIGRRIAELLKCEAAMVSAGCASALTLATAACVAGDDPERIRCIPDTTGMKDEVLVQRSHRVGYDHAIRNAGVRLIEIETAEELEKKINERTAMMFFLNSSDPQGKIHHEEFVALGKKHNIPTLIDAAADVPPIENLFRFTKIGFDLVAFSGGKGLCGPQSSGLLLGRKNLIAAARLNNNPNSDSICRTNKVNKEELVGMLVALELFLNRDHAAVWKEWEARASKIIRALSEFSDVKAEVQVPAIANAVPHLHIRWDFEKRKLSPSQMADKLRDGEPSIEVVPGSRRELVVGVWMMQPGDDAIVAQRIRQILAST
ncbi:MAG: aminotransferase class V-fold PLP-dependent enzyme [Planctomycetia bacterium]|nr:aminotransferase class V-fold PLP-dependent enzyme [Planctomycetia bacterium]